MDKNIKLNYTRISHCDSINRKYKESNIYTELCEQINSENDMLSDNSNSTTDRKYNQLFIPDIEEYTGWVGNRADFDAYQGKSSYAKHKKNYRNSKSGNSYFHKTYFQNKNPNNFYNFRSKDINIDNTFYHTDMTLRLQQHENHGFYEYFPLKNELNTGEYMHNLYAQQHSNDYNTNYYKTNQDKKYGSSESFHKYFEPTNTEFDNWNNYKYYSLDDNYTFRLINDQNKSYLSNNYPVVYTEDDFRRIKFDAQVYWSKIRYAEKICQKKNYANINMQENTHTKFQQNSINNGNMQLKLNEKSKHTKENDITTDVNKIADENTYDDKAYTNYIPENDLHTDAGAAGTAGAPAAPAAPAANLDFNKSTQKKETQENKSNYTPLKSNIIKSSSPIDIKTVSNGVNSLSNPISLLNIPCSYDNIKGINKEYEYMYGNTWPITNYKKDKEINNYMISQYQKQYFKSVNMRKKKFIDTSDSEKKSYCINCGKYGHLFKKCIYPILSFGLIGYYYDTTTQDISFIMIQSKNTFHFLDFIRGKYDLLDLESISKLFINMTFSEIEMIKSKNFDLIWKETYHDIYTLNDIQENQKKISKTKFEFLAEGVVIGNFFYNLDYFLDLNKDSKIEISWSFPKGRRNYKESDLMCAIREFEEETSLKRKFFEIKEPKKIYCETYVGDNNIEYQHRYFLAEFHQKIELEINNMNSHQIIEIGMLNWLNKDEAIRNINPFYKQRIEIVNQFIADILENKKKNYDRKNTSFCKNLHHNHKSNALDKTDRTSKQPYFQNIFDNSKAYLSNSQNINADDNNEDHIFLPD
jgi:8-oxo-dGTP pyrophosphatase MutT (NUDIX family)